MCSERNLGGIGLQEHSLLRLLPHSCCLLRSSAIWVLREVSPSDGSPGRRDFAVSVRIPSYFIRHPTWGTADTPQLLPGTARYEQGALAKTALPTTPTAARIYPSVTTTTTTMATNTSTMLTRRRRRIPPPPPDGPMESHWELIKWVRRAREQLSGSSGFSVRFQGVQYSVGQISEMAKSKFLTLRVAQTQDL